jgi:hypothetical protein
VLPLALLCGKNKNIEPHPSSSSGWITKEITKELKGKNASENAFSTARRKLIERG